MTSADLPDHMHPTRSFQGLILTLHNYWADKGCAVLQPYDMEVGAGTFHPATTLRALGPRPWKAAYVQPSRRPSDGRYGENPNRLQHYYQYQVILKPNPSNLQELYLGSLAAIEIPASISPAPTPPTTSADPKATYPPDPMRDALHAEDRIEVPVFTWPHTPAGSAPPRRLLRISAQLYNEPADYDRLAAALVARRND